MTVAKRTAGAPISWGVCEVPGWGHQMSPRRVLGEMRDLGLAATEVGPAGFLPDDPRERASLLDGYGLGVAGAFVPVVLHDPDASPLAAVERAWDGLAPDVMLILAAATGLDGYDRRPDLDTRAWVTLLANLDAVTALARDRGRRVCLHPHVGTVVEQRHEVERVLGGSTVPLCLDTGHLAVGGTDPAWLARFAASRVAHVHLKDVDMPLADRVRDGHAAYRAAVGEGLYRPLGQGDIDIPAVIGTLEGAGYDGWYVMEQDTILAGEPEDGPRADVRASLDHLHDLLKGAAG